jgi:hypothetical protein
MVTLRHTWSKLNHLQIGRYAEYFFKMQFVLSGLDVYSAEVDDRGIDFVVRAEPNRYWDVQVKSIRKGGYIFFPKRNFSIRENLLASIALFQDGHEPDLYLIPATRWSEPNTIFVDHDYEGLKSKPEYGINISAKGKKALEPFRFETQVETIFGRKVPD